MSYLSAETQLYVACCRSHDRLHVACAGVMCRLHVIRFEIQGHDNQGFVHVVFIVFYGILFMDKTLVVMTLCFESNINKKLHE